MRALFLSIVLALSMTACSTAPTKPETIYVKVPTKCEPTTAISKIDPYPVDKVSKEDSLFNKVQAALEELELIKSQNTQLKAALTECTQ